MSLTNDDGTPRKLKYLGSYEGGSAVNIVIPAGAFERVEQSFAAERAAREAEALKARQTPVRQARARGRLKKALTAIFRRSQ
jgi:hypothetical protein